jgi:Kef-type K+ transport system membrane component KefB
VILAAAVVDDVLGLIVLALVTGLARGPVNYLDIALTGAIALAFTYFVATLGTRTVEKILPHVHANVSLAEAEFALAMTLLFGLSLLAVYAGIAAIVGAFLAGMALGEQVDRRVHELTLGVTELLVPFFLVGIGLRFDLSAFATKSVLALAGSIVIAAMISKFTACSLGAFRMGRADAMRIGVGMIPHGEVGMVVAQIGLSIGVMPQSVYGIIVFMSMATTLLAPPLLKLAFRGVRASDGLGEEVVHIG